MTRRWIFLRGWAREARHWGAFPEDFAALHPEASIEMPDLPGAGLRNAERSPSTVAGIVERLRERAAITAPIHLLGISLGGMVCLEWARRHPGEVAAVVTINTSAGRLSTARQRMRPGNYAAVLRAFASRDPRTREALILERTSRDPGAHPGVVEAWTAYARERPMATGAALAQLLAASRFDLDRKSMEVPLLVLASSGDGLVDPACSRAIARACNGALATHPTAGHDLSLDDGPWVAAQVRRWLKRT